MRFTVLKLVFVISLVVLLSPPALAKSPERIVAMGDVHGDLERLTTIMETAGLIDVQHQWVGGDSIFVLTGDFTDRGPRVRGVMDLLMDLQKQARRSGGEVIVLLGNHEMMNIVGDLRYVTNEIYSEFVDEESEGQREEAYKKYIRVQERHAKLLKEKSPDQSEEARAEWNEAHPPGYFEYREAMGPKGHYGRWLRHLPVAVKLGGQVFLHGGIHPKLADLDLDALNERVLKERESFDSLIAYLSSQQVIEHFFSLDEIIQSVRNELRYLQIRAGVVSEDELSNNGWLSRLREGDRQRAQIILALNQIGSWLSMHPDGPLWFRGYGTWTEEEGAAEVAKVLEVLDAEHFVVGHTITSDREIRQRLGGRVLLIDTVIPVALEISGGKFTAIYEEGREPVQGEFMAAETVNPALKSANP